MVILFFSNTDFRDLTDIFLSLQSGESVVVLFFLNTDFWESTDNLYPSNRVNLWSFYYSNTDFRDLTDNLFIPLIG